MELSPHLLWAFLVFAVVMFFTPGPNNIMLLSSGLNFGFRRTIPHMAGVTFGFAFMIAVTGLGLGAVFTTYPVLQTVLKSGLTGSGPIPDGVVLPADPIAEMAAGRYHKVPVLSGYTADEA